MQKILQLLKNRYAILTMAFIAILAIGFNSGRNSAKSDNCPGTAPSVPTFNFWPITYSGEACHDLVMIDAKNLSAPAGTRDSRYAVSQTEHDQGISANVGDHVRVSIYFHNGASDQISRDQTTANNTSASSNFDAASSNTSHNFSATVSASNASTITSADKGGDIVVHTQNPTVIQYVPGSARLCVQSASIGQFGFMSGFSQIGTCPDGSAMFAVPDSLINDGSAGLGAIPACFQFSGQIFYETVVSAGTTGGTSNMSITKQVRNVTQGTGFSSSTSAKQNELVAYQVVVTNTGTTNLTNVTFSDPGASGLNMNAQSSSIGTLTPGDSRNFTYTATVTASSGTIVNTATANSNETGSKTASATVNVTSVSGTSSMSITKQVRNVTQGTGFASSTSAKQNELVAYQVVVTNTGTTNLTNVTFSDPGANGLSMSAQSSSIGTLVSGDSRTFTYTATVTASSGTIVNTATATSTETGSKTASATVNVTAVSGTSSMSITKQVRNVTTGTGFSSSTSAHQNDTVAYQVVVTNTGTTNLSNVSFNDPGASGLNMSPQSSFIGTLTPSDSRTFSYTATVTISSGTITNTATATSTETGSKTASATVTVSTSGSAATSIAKQVMNITQGSTGFAKSITAKQGDTVRYQVTIRNTGTMTLTNVSLTDPGASGLNINSSVTSGVALGTLAVGNQTTFTYDATVTASSGTIVNTATARATEAGPVSDTATINVSCTNCGTPGLSITKQVRNVTSGGSFSNSASARTNDTVAYHVVVTNSGASALTNVVFNDPGASGLNMSPQSSFIGSMNPGDSRTFDYTAVVTATSGTITNTATAASSQTATATASATVTVSGGGNSSFSLVKGVLDQTQGQSAYVNNINALNGDTVRYQITLTNTGSNTLNNINFTDNMPSGLNVVSGSLGVNVGFSGNVNNFTISSLPAGQSAIINYTATVNTTCGTFTNTVTANASNATGSQSASATVNVVCNPTVGNLQVTKQVKNVSQGTGFSKQVSANPGDKVGFLIQIRALNGNLNNVTVLDNLPFGLNFNSGSANLNGNSFGSNFINNVTNIGSLTNGNVDTVYFEAFVNSNMQTGQTILTNTVNASADNIPTLSDSATIVINTGTSGFCQIGINKQVRNLTFGNILTKSVSAFSSDRIGYQITVTNTGSQQLNNVSVTENLPSGINLVSGTVQMNGSSMGDFQSGSQMFIGTLSPGQQDTVTFQATISAGNGATLQNTATATSSCTGTVSDTATVFVNSSVAGSFINLIMSKSAFNDTKNIDATSAPANKEDFITYTLNVSNTGNGDAQNFVVSDDLSNVLTYATVTDTNGGTMNSNVISWPATTIPAGSSIQRKFKVRVNFSLPSTGSFNLVNTFGNTVTVRIANPQVLGATFVAPKTGASATFGFIFAGLLTAAFAWIERKGLLKLLPKLRIK